MLRDSDALRIPATAYAQTLALIAYQHSTPIKMTRIEELENIYQRYFKDTFDKLGLVKYEESDHKMTAGVMRFKNDHFRIQLLNHHGVYETDLSNSFENGQFLAIEMFNSLLLLEADKNLSESEKRKILGRRLDFEGQSNFLIDNSEKIKMLLNKENYKDTFDRINEIFQAT